MTRYPVDNTIKQKTKEADEYFYSGRRPEAIRLYNDILYTEPDCVYVLVQRGLALQEERKLSLAIQDYQRAIELDPEYGPAYYGHAWAKGWQHDYEGELTDAQKGYELDPEHPAMYLRRLGAALTGLKRYKDAIKVYNQTLALNLNDEGTLYNRSMCYFQMKQFGLALNDLNHALELDPDWDWAFNQRALVYEQLDKLDEAIKDIDQAIHYNPNYRPALIARPRILRKKRNKQFKEFLKKIFNR